METVEKTIEITNGPSREELFDGLRLSSEKRLIPFCFQMNGREKFVAVIIGSIQVDDASNNFWNLTLSVNKRFVSEEMYFCTLEPKKKESGVFSEAIDFDFFRNLTDENYLLQEYRKDLITVKANYSTKTRKGKIIASKIILSLTDKIDEKFGFPQSWLKPDLNTKFVTVKEFIDNPETVDTWRYINSYVEGIEFSSDVYEHIDKRFFSAEECEARKKDRDSKNG